MTSARNYFWYGTIVTLAGVTLVFLVPRKKGPSSPPPAPTATICERPSKMERDIPINEIRGESEETDAILELSAKMDGTSRTDEPLLESEETASPDEIRKLNSESEGESRITETSEETDSSDEIGELPSDIEGASRTEETPWESGDETAADRSPMMLALEIQDKALALGDTKWRLRANAHRLRLLSHRLNKHIRAGSGEDMILRAAANLCKAKERRDELENAACALLGEIGDLEKELARR